MFNRFFVVLLAALVLGASEARASTIELYPNYLGGGSSFGFLNDGPYNVAPDSELVISYSLTGATFGGDGLVWLDSSLGIAIGSGLIDSYSYTNAGMFLPAVNNQSTVTTAPGASSYTVSPFIDTITFAGQNAVVTAINPTPFVAQLDDGFTLQVPNVVVSQSISSVPLPPSALLFGAALIGLAGFTHFKRTRLL